MDEIIKFLKSFGLGDKEIESVINRISPRPIWFINSVENKFCNVCVDNSKCINSFSEIGKFFIEKFGSL